MENAKNETDELHENEEPIAEVKVYEQTTTPLYFMTRECATFSVNNEEGSILSTLNGTLLVRFRDRQYAVHSKDVVKAVLEVVGVNASSNNGEG